MKRKKKKKKLKRNQLLHSPLHNLVHERRRIPDLHRPRNGISNPPLRQPQRTILTHLGRTTSRSDPHMQQHPPPRSILNPLTRLHIRLATLRRRRPSVAPIKAKIPIRLFSKQSFPSTTLSRTHPSPSWFPVWAP